MTELKTPGPNELSFEANGKTYFLETKISIDRKILCDKLMVELGSGFPISEQVPRLKEAYEAANKGRLADCCVMLHNLMSGIKTWERQEDTVMRIAALYINHKEEDRRFITDAQIADKIKDWQEAGIEYGFFISIVQALLKPLIHAWNDISANTLNVATAKNQEA